MNMIVSNVFNVLHNPADIEKDTSLSGTRILTSRPVETPFSFASLFLSVNCQFPPNSYALIEVQVRADNKWSGFYKLALLSAQLKTSFPPQADEYARVNTDELELSVPAQAYRYRIHLSGGAEADLIAATLVKTPFLYNEKTSSKLPLRAREVGIVPLSQLEQKTPQKRRICSPTSLLMALTYLGIDTDIKQVMDGVFDATASIYGNWLFNVVYASQVGATAYVRRFAALTELEQFITPDTCVIASIAFDKGDLANAPMSHTTGHLVVLRGWKNGKVLVADPAAPRADSVLRAYNAQEFAHAWLKRKKGISYIVRKK
jgi:hypothetical protein